MTLAVIDGVAIAGKYIVDSAAPQFERILEAKLASHVFYMGFDRTRAASECAGNFRRPISHPNQTEDIQLPGG
jgi:hypothetical protein